ncbi:RNA-directed DNA polymerase, eukaryota, reverse transcriptase zinc-binding domain protein [Tanacetum coccineum]
MITQELLKGYNCKNSPSRCSLKIDIAKAYDTVDWNFWQATLENFGFHSRMVCWIMTCVSSATFTIGINGERNRYFKSGRGLRQGDPVSPYLFTLIMEVFSLMLARKVKENSISVIKEALMEFSNSSSLKPNMDTSVVFFGSVKEMVKQRILEVLPFKVGKLPMKYLGIPLLAKKLGINYCKQLVEKVKHKIEDWKNRFLSYAGRLQLIASVLAIMQTYWASVLEKIGDLSKQIWKIIAKKEGLWFKWVNLVKLKGKSFWEIEEEENDSGTWNALLGLRNKYKMNMRRIPDNWNDIVKEVAELPCTNAIINVLRRLILATSVNYIWKERNSRLFSNNKMNAQTLLDSIEENIRLQLQGLNVKESIQVRQVADEWNVKMKYHNNTIGRL